MAFARERERESDSRIDLDFILSQIIKLESNLDFDKEPTPKSPPQGRGLSYSPALAEGARGWVENLTALLKSLPTPPKNGWDTIALSNSDIFELQIGERVLDSELHEQGKIPVYSANVTKPFGFIEKELLEKLENYDKDSVLWGIDGDFMVSFIPKNTPFYPTDHCGVLRVKDKSVNVRIAGFGLENEGAKFGFSRNLRASISRIKSLKIPLPPLSEQNKIIAPIEWIESKITALDSALSALESTKSKILQKYL